MLWFTVDYFLTLGSNITSQLGEYIGGCRCLARHCECRLMFFGCPLSMSFAMVKVAVHCLPLGPRGRRSHRTHSDVISICYCSMNRPEYAGIVVLLNHRSSIFYWGKGDKTTIELLVAPGSLLLVGPSCALQTPGCSTCEKEALEKIELLQIHTAQ